MSNSGCPCFKIRADSNPLVPAPKTQIFFTDIDDPYKIKVWGGIN
jgi:hypothetical protein